jgi:hypothetical protein
MIPMVHDFFRRLDRHLVLNELHFPAYGRQNAIFRTVQSEPGLNKEKTRIEPGEETMPATHTQRSLTSGPSRLKTVLIGLSLAFALGRSSLAVAQTFYADPPKGFDPVAASETERAQYGFPPAPDRSEAAAYASWLKMVTTRQTRLKDAKTQVTDFRHTTAMNEETPGVAANGFAANNNTWSGYAVIAPNNTFTSTNNQVYAQWVVPAVGGENCADAPIQSSQWIGLDGWNGPEDVLQAGTAITACGTSYVAWYEWYTKGCSGNSPTLPCYQTNVSLAVNPGDLIDVQVWYTTAADNGHAYILNVTSGVSVSVSFNQPSGVAGSGYKGATVEWVVERPSLGNVPVNLANYESVVMNEARAQGVNGTYYPSSSPAGTTIWNITMTCPSWNPSSACTSTTDLSYVNLYGTWTLWFYPEGPAISLLRKAQF